MEQKIFTVAIIGCGGRGVDAYGSLINEKKDRFKIVALCDKRGAWLEKSGELFGVDKENLFLTEKKFFKKKRADLLLIATPDDCHVRHALKGFKLGYDLMIEKPLSDKKSDCAKLLKAKKKYGGKALVCHVLRYAPAFMKAKEILSSGEIGDLVSVDALERVGAWHYAHSYTRGNWRNRKIAAPMILAKCCHDLDLLQYYAGAKCKTVSSVGDLRFFNANHKPEGATERCLDCPHADTCAFSAKRQYLDGFVEKGCPEDLWPFNIVTIAPVTLEKLNTALREGPYGRCVFACDNDVVDHQHTLMTFENGVKASLTMTAFTGWGGRRITFYCTHGDLVLDEQSQTLSVTKFGEKIKVIPVADLVEKGYGHGGGDAGLINKLYDVLSGTVEVDTSLEASLESHLIGIRAEESRLKGGKLLRVH